MKQELKRKYNNIKYRVYIESFIAIACVISITGESATFPFLSYIVFASSLVCLTKDTVKLFQYDKKLQEKEEDKKEEKNEEKEKVKENLDGYTLEKAKLEELKRSMGKDKPKEYVKKRL